VKLRLRLIEIEMRLLPKTECETVGYRLDGDEVGVLLPGRDLKPSQNEPKTTQHNKHK